MLGIPVGLEVLHRTCRTVGQLADEASPFTVVVNISARQLVDPELPERLADELPALLKRIGRRPDVPVSER